MLLPIWRSQSSLSSSWLSSVCCSSGSALIAPSFPRKNLGDFSQEPCQDKGERLPSDRAGLEGIWAKIPHSEGEVSFWKTTSELQSCALRVFKFLNTRSEGKDFQGKTPGGENLCSQPGGNCGIKGDKRQRQLLPPGPLSLSGTISFLTSPLLPLFCLLSLYRLYIYI